MTETELLSILSSHGADFTATPRDLESKHGRSAWLDLPSWPIVRVPTTPLFPEHTDSFYVSLAVPLAQLAPVTRYTTELNPYDDAHKNHALALSRLTTLFGVAPRERATSNTLGHGWSAGDVDVTITSFTKPSPGNTVEQQRPNSRHRTSIVAESAWAPEWDSADANATLLRAETCAFPTQSLRKLEPKTFHVRFGGYLRRLPPTVSEPVTGAVVLFADGASNRFGFVCGRMALVAPRSVLESVIHTRIHPARGGGHSTIALRMRDAFSDPATQVDLTLFDHEDTEGMNDWAPRVGNLLKLPLRAEEGIDD